MNQTPIQNAIARVMPQAIASGLLVSLCTIQKPDGTYTSGGAPSGNFVNVDGLINIQCMDAVDSVGSIQATETKTLADIMSKGIRHVFLNGYYPQIISAATIVTGVGAGWRAVVDGIAYDLLGAEPDSQNTQTRLHLQLVSV
jgi:hypothetical protein